jgi:hypothetical protein
MGTYFRMIWTVLQTLSTPLLNRCSNHCGRIADDSGITSSHIRLKTLLSCRYAVPSVGFEPTLYGF